MDIKELILAIMSEAKASGITPILRTTLIKKIFLVDVYTAQENNGSHLSGLEWKFLHYGPYSSAAANAIEELVQSRQITKTEKENITGEKEFILYDLNDYTRPKNLRDLGLASIQLQLAADMKRYGKDLNLLLNHIYFATSPMRNAKPGQILDFSECIKPNKTDFCILEMKQLPKKKIQETRKKLDAFVTRRKNQTIIVQGPIDDVYNYIDTLEGEHIHTGVSGKAKIQLNQQGSIDGNSSDN